MKRASTSGGRTRQWPVPSHELYGYGLTNGTTYYYVVTAVNSAGESGNSNQASATPALVLVIAKVSVSRGSNTTGGALARFRRR